jgi:hypothetical protein
MSADDNTLATWAGYWLRYTSSGGAARPETIETLPDGFGKTGETSNG